MPGNRGDPVVACRSAISARLTMAAAVVASYRRGRGSAGPRRRPPTATGCGRQCRSWEVSAYCSCWCRRDPVRHGWLWPCRWWRAWPPRRRIRLPPPGCRTPGPCRRWDRPVSTAAGVRHPDTGRAGGLPVGPGARWRHRRKFKPGGGLLDSPTPSAALTALLAADAAHYRWAAAVVGSNNAAGYQLAARVPVMAVGGFQRHRSGTHARAVPAVRRRGPDSLLRRRRRQDGLGTSGRG